MQKKTQILILFVLSFQIAVSQYYNYVEIVKAYADEMLINGQDHYGEIYSPLFSTALTRADGVASLLPYPVFQSRETSSTPGDHWLFETYFVNIPMLGAERNGSGKNGNHGMEKPHKQIVSGDNPLDNLGVYKTFYKLSELLGTQTYKTAAQNSLEWFYKNTQGPSGLYPWGEHLGWDFRYDYVTYHIKGYEDFIINPYRGENTEPIMEMYQSWQHEPRGMYVDWEPFLHILAKLPATQNEFYKPIEKYALGIWEQHFFDKEKGYYNRHGDYFGLKRGIEGKYGGDMMFPKYTGYFIETWAIAYEYSENYLFKAQISDCIHKLVKANEELHNQYGFRPSLISGGNYDTRQCLQMAYQIIKSGKRMEKENPALSEYMIQYGKKEIDFFCNYVDNNLKKYQSKDPETLYYAYIVTKDERLLKLYEIVAQDIIKNGNTQMRYNAGQAGKCIETMVRAYELFGKKQYLKEAEKRGKQAVELYFTKESVLPKCVPADEITTVNGEKWTTYYYSHLGSDDLMYSLAELAAIMNK